MEPTKDHDQATAYHEAGHAVVALILGRPVKRVSILPKHERLGTCEFGKSEVGPTEDWLNEKSSLPWVASRPRHVLRETTPGTARLVIGNM